MSGFKSLAVHPDLVDGVRALERSGLRLITLSNGPADVTDGLLTAAGIRDSFETLLSVDAACVWKPAEAAYAYAARTCQVDLSAMLLVGSRRLRSAQSALGLRTGAHSPRQGLRGRPVRL